MRSVIAFFHEEDRNEIMNCLSAMCTNNQDKQWVYLKKGDPVLYIEFDDARSLMNEFDPEDEQDVKLKSFLEQEEYNLVLVIDISGRHTGTEEVLTVVTSLLSKFDGVVIDDFSAHAWTIQEILDGSCYLNHKFFDYDGWYKDRVSLKWTAT